MSIPVATLQRELHAIAKATGRTVDADMLERYHGYLDKRMSEQEFVAAARALYGGEFFPRPEEIIEALPSRDVLRLPVGRGTEGPLDPYQPVVVTVTRNPRPASPKPGDKQSRYDQVRDYRLWEETVRVRRETPLVEGVDYWVDSRGLRCSIRSRRFADEQGRGFPMVQVRVVDE